MQQQAKLFTWKLVVVSGISLSSLELLLDPQNVFEQYPFGTNTSTIFNHFFYYT